MAEIIDRSWARVESISPYYIYLKIAYHLSHEAIAGLSEFRIPREFNNLFDFQKAAVQLAARHVTRRGGVGLGKTLVGTALAKILQEDCYLETLILCQSVMVFQPHKLPEVKYNHDKLTVINVFADWQITPADIFSWLMVK